ncbi:MAG TPA: RNA polymerase sigma factor RpoD/SigA [Fibrobacteria bacterium]|jgi:RNA polymerase primary sigma factor|nr:RNA polymerase sigma factor RpoD/SigA [Fibrobacteria bacterium]
MVDLNEQLYFRDLYRYRILTPEEEKDLVHRVRRGDPTALNPLILGNLRFVVSIARRYQGKGLSLLELINEGNLGLYKAAKRYDPSRDVKFISYAVWWIRQSIQKALFEQVGAVRIPPNKLALVNRFKRALLQNGGNYEKTVSLPEFETHEKEIAEIMEKIADMSLNAPIGGEGDGRDPVTTLLDVLGTEGGQEVDAEKAELSRSLDSVLGQMSEREEKVLRMYYGINYAREFTLDEIGRELKLTRERVRQIKNRSLRKLLRSRESKEKLLPFVSGNG